LLNIITFSCNKEQRNALNLTAVDNNNSKIINVKLETKSSQTLPIGCHDIFSKFFDERNHIFGYQDCNSVYHLIDVKKCKEIKQIPLSMNISISVVDINHNQIIGHYWENLGETMDNCADHVVVINKENGNIVSDKIFSSGLVFWDPSTRFFKEPENEYVLLRSDNVLVFINPSTGKINRTLSIGTNLGLGVYDKKRNRLIGSTYSNETNENYIVTVDLASGNILNRVVAQGLSFHKPDAMDYDPETDSYILVSSNNEVLFFNVETGELTECYPMDFDITSLSIWRSRNKK
jgi:hypothetical protein